MSSVTTLPDFDGILTTSKFTPAKATNGWYWGPSTSVVRAIDYITTTAVSGSCCSYFTTSVSNPCSYIFTVMSGLNTSTSYTITFWHSQRTSGNNPNAITVNVFDGTTLTTIYSTTPSTTSFVKCTCASFTPSSSTVMLIFAVKQTDQSTTKEYLMDCVQISPGNASMSFSGISSSLPFLPQYTNLCASPVTIYGQSASLVVGDFENAYSTTGSNGYTDTAATLCGWFFCTGGYISLSTSVMGSAPPSGSYCARLQTDQSTLFRPYAYTFLQGLDTSTSYTIKLHISQMTSQNATDQFYVNVFDGYTCTTIYSGPPTSVAWTQKTCTAFTPTTTNVLLIVGVVSTSAGTRVVLFDNVLISPATQGMSYGSTTPSGRIVPNNRVMAQVLASPLTYTADCVIGDWQYNGGNPGSTLSTDGNGGNSSTGTTSYNGWMAGYYTSSYSSQAPSRTLGCRSLRLSTQFAGTGGYQDAFVWTNLTGLTPDTAYTISFNSRKNGTTMPILTVNVYDGKTITTISTQRPASSSYSTITCTPFTATRTSVFLIIAATHDLTITQQVISDLLVDYMIISPGSASIQVNALPTEGSILPQYSGLYDLLYRRALRLPYSSPYADSTYYIGSFGTFNPSGGSLTVAGAGRGWYYSSDFGTTTSSTATVQSSISTFVDPSLCALRMEVRHDTLPVNYVYTTLTGLSTSTAYTVALSIATPTASPPYLCVHTWDGTTLTPIYSALGPAQATTSMTPVNCTPFTPTATQLMLIVIVRQYDTTVNPRALLIEHVSISPYTTGMSHTDTSNLTFHHLLTQAIGSTVTYNSSTPMLLNGFEDIMSWNFSTGGLTAGATSYMSWTYSPTVFFSVSTSPLPYQNSTLASLPLTSTNPRTYMYTVISGLDTSRSYTVSFYAYLKQFYPPDEMNVNLFDGVNLYNIFNGVPTSNSWVQFTCRAFTPTSPKMMLILCTKLYSNTSSSVAGDMYLDAIQITPSANLTMAPSGLDFQTTYGDLPSVTIDDFESIGTTSTTTSISGAVGKWFWGTGALLANASGFGSVAAPSGTYSMCLQTTSSDQTSYIYTVVSGLSTSTAYTLSFYVSLPTGQSAPSQFFVNTWDGTTATPIHSGYNSTTGAYNQISTCAFTPTQSTMMIVFTTNSASTTYQLIDLVSISPSTVGLSFASSGSVVYASSALATPQGSLISYALRDCDFENLYPTATAFSSLGGVTKCNWVLPSGAGVVHSNNYNAATYCHISTISGTKCLGLQNATSATRTLTNLNPNGTIYNVSFYAALAYNFRSTPPTAFTVTINGSTAWTMASMTFPADGMWVKSSTGSFIPTSTTATVVFATTGSSLVLIDEVSVTALTGTVIGTSPTFSEYLPGTPAVSAPGLIPYGDFDSLNTFAQCGCQQKNWVFDPNAGVCNQHTPTYFPAQASQGSKVGIIYLTSSATSGMYTVLTGLDSTKYYQISLSMYCNVSSGAANSAAFTITMSQGGINTNTIWSGLPSTANQWTAIKCSTFRGYTSVRLSFKGTSGSNNPFRLAIDNVQIADAGSSAVSSVVSSPTYLTTPASVTTSGLLQFGDFSMPSGTLSLPSLSGQVNGWVFGTNTGIFREFDATYFPWKAASSPYVAGIYNTSSASAAFYTQLNGMSSSSTYYITFHLSGTPDVTAPGSSAFSVVVTDGGSYTKTIFNELPAPSNAMTFAQSLPFTPPSGSSTLTLTFTGTRGSASPQRIYVDNVSILVTSDTLTPTPTANVTGVSTTPLLHYPFNNTLSGYGSTTTSATPVSFSSSNGFVAAAFSTVSPPVGSGYVLLARAGLVQLPTFTNTLNGMTIAFWLNQSLTTQSSACVFCMSSSGWMYTYDQLSMFSNYGALSVAATTNNQSVLVNGTTFITGTMPPNTWMHVALTITAPTSTTNAVYTIYVNGVPQTSTSAAAYPTVISRPFHMLGFAKGNGTTDFMLNGSMCEYRYYDTSLSAPQVVLLSQNTGATISGISTTPTFYYPLATDTTGYGSVTTSAFLGSFVPPIGTACVNFGSSNQQIVALSSFTNTTNGMTFAFWARLDTSSGGRFMSFSTNNAADSSNSGIYWTCQAAAYGGMTLGGSFYLQNFATLTNVWYHWVVTIQYAGTSGASSVYTSYINGVSQNTATQAYPAITTRTQNYLGVGSSSYVSGASVCDFRYYDACLTQSQFNALYANRLYSTSTSPTAGTVVSGVDITPILYYPFNYGDMTSYGSTTTAATAVLTAYTNDTTAPYPGNGFTASLGLSAASTQSVSIPSVTVGSTGLTVGCWVKATSSSSSNARLWSFSTLGSVDNINGVALYRSSNQWMVSVPTNASLTNTGATNVFDGTWRYVAMTYQCTGLAGGAYMITLYLNGQNVGSATSFYPLIPPGTKRYCYVGAGAQNYLTGSVSDFRVYNACLTPMEIMNLYNFPQKQVQWPLCAATPITASGLVPNGDFEGLISGTMLSINGAVGKWHFTDKTGIIRWSEPFNATSTLLFGTMAMPRAPWKPVSGEFLAVFWNDYSTSAVTTSISTYLTGLSTTTAYNLQFDMGSGFLPILTGGASTSTAYVLPASFKVTVSTVDWAQDVWTLLPSKDAAPVRVVSKAFVPPSSNVRVDITASRGSDIVATHVLFLDNVSILLDVSGTGQATSMNHVTTDMVTSTASGVLPNGDFNFSNVANNFLPGLSWRIQGLNIPGSAAFLGQNGCMGGTVTDVGNSSYVFGPSFDEYSTPSANYDIECRGYFIPTSTGTWTFNVAVTGSQTYFQIGQPAIPFPVVIGASNAMTTMYSNFQALLTNVTGVTTSLVTLTKTIELTANVCYPVRIFSTSSNPLYRITFSGPGVSTRSDGTGYFYRGIPTPSTLPSPAIDRPYNNMTLNNWTFGDAGIHSGAKCALPSGSTAVLPGFTWKIYSGQATSIDWFKTASPGYMGLTTGTISNFANATVINTAIFGYTPYQMDFSLEIVGFFVPPISGYLNAVNIVSPLGVSYILLGDTAIDYGVASSYSTVIAAGQPLPVRILLVGSLTSLSFTLNTTGNFVVGPDLTKYCFSGNMSMGVAAIDSGTSAAYIRSNPYFLYKPQMYTVLVNLNRAYAYNIKAWVALSQYTSVPVFFAIKVSTGTWSRIIFRSNTFIGDGAWVEICTEPFLPPAGVTDNVRLTFYVEQFSTSSNAFTDFLVHKVQLLRDTTGVGTAQYMAEVVNPSSWTPFNTTSGLVPNSDFSNFTTSNGSVCLGPSLINQWYFPKMTGVTKLPSNRGWLSPPTGNYAAYVMTTLHLMENYLSTTVTGFTVGTSYNIQFGMMQDMFNGFPPENVTVRIVGGTWQRTIFNGFPTTYKIPMWSVITTESFVAPATTLRLVFTVVQNPINSFTSAALFNTVVVLGNTTLGSTMVPCATMATPNTSGLLPYADFETITTGSGSIMPNTVSRQWYFETNDGVVKLPSSGVFSAPISGYYSAILNPQTGNGPPPTSIHTTLNSMVPGTPYSISMMSAYGGSGGVPSALTVTVADAETSTTIYNGVPGIMFSNITTSTFTPVTTSMLLSISATAGNLSTYVYVDNVSVVGNLTGNVVSTFGSGTVANTTTPTTPANTVVSGNALVTYTTTTATLSNISSTTRQQLIATQTAVAALALQTANTVSANVLQAFVAAQTVYQQKLESFATTRKTAKAARSQLLASYGL